MFCYYCYGINYVLPSKQNPGIQEDKWNITCKAHSSLYIWGFLRQVFKTVMLSTDSDGSLDQHLDFSWWHPEQRLSYYASDFWPVITVSYKFVFFLADKIVLICYAAMENKYNSPCPFIGRFGIIKMSTLFKLVNRFKAIKIIISEFLQKIFKNWC